MEQNVAEIIREIKEVASTILEKDISTVKGFSERQVEALARQTAIVRQGIASGDIDEELQAFFEQGLKDMARNFVNTLKGLLSVTIEKIWNAVVEVLLRIINKGS